MPELLSFTSLRFPSPQCSSNEKVRPTRSYRVEHSAVGQDRTSNDSQRSCSSRPNKSNSNTDSHCAITKPHLGRYLHVSRSLRKYLVNFSHPSLSLNHYTAVLLEWSPNHEPDSDILNKRLFRIQPPRKVIRRIGFMWSPKGT